MNNFKRNFIENLFCSFFNSRFQHLNFFFINYTVHLIKIYFTGGLFKCYKKLFIQIDGVSMGNQLAPTIANYFMGTLEKLCLIAKMKTIQCYTSV